MEFLGIFLVSLSCILFIHLGLGDTLCKIIKHDFILFRCQKCLNFWVTLSYSLCFTSLPIEASFFIAFALSYIALWIDLGLAKIAKRYDYWYEQANEDLGDETAPKDSGGKGHSRDRQEKEKNKNGFLS